MKKKVKLIVGGAVGLLALAAAAALLLAPMGLELAELQPRTARVTFTEQGVYDYDRSYQVYPLVTGEILEVLVKEGDSVRKGDALAVVSASDYQYQIEQLESSIAGYSSQIVGLREEEQLQRDTLTGTRNNLMGQLAALQAQMDTVHLTEESRQNQIDLQQRVVYENRQMVRYYREQMREARTYGEQELETTMEQALNQARQAEANSLLALEQLLAGDNTEGYVEGQIQSIQGQIDAIDAQLAKSYTTGMAGYYNSLITAAQSSIDQMDEKQGQAVIAAPVSGVVTRLTADRANVAGTQAEIAVIGWDALVEVYVPVRELDHVQAGDTVELTLDKRAGEETVPGTVAAVEERAEVRLSALGVEERKVRVLIRPQQSMTIGADMDVTFTVAVRENSLVAPKTALFTLDGRDMVWAVREGAARRVPVEKGMETREGYVIESGLEPGERVVRDANVQGLSDGKRVRQA